MLFNKSRSKKALIKETQRRFRARGWVIKRDAALINLGIDFSAKSQMTTFEIVCLDRMLGRFLSETSILDRFEYLTRQIRLRKMSLIVVTDEHQNDGFIKASRDRGLVFIKISEIASVTSIIDYVDCLPDAIDSITLRVLESSSSACASLMYRFSKAGNKAAAIEWGRRALKSYFGYFVHNALFSLLIENDEFDLAKEVGEEALSFKPKDAFCFFQGFQKIASKRGDDSGAVAWAERWIKSESDNPLAYGNLATLYQRQGEGALATLTINKALELAPNDPGMLRQAAVLALGNNDLDTAFVHASRWVLHAADDAGAHEILADVLLKRARYDEASVAITDAMAIHSDRPSLLRKASLVALHRGDLPGAMQFAERWCSIAPSDAWAHDHLSTLYLRGGNYEQAQAANAEALELDPINSIFLRHMQQIQAKAGFARAP